MVLRAWEPYEECHLKVTAHCLRQRFVETANPQEKTPGDNVDGERADDETFRRYSSKVGASVGFGTRE